jgi:hypothetical protein
LEIPPFWVVYIVRRTLNAKGVFYMKKMEKKNFLMGILMLTLVFGVCVTGCLSINRSYYNLGDVSEENCALIQVSPVGYEERKNDKTDRSEYRIVNFVKIDGQGDKDQWSKVDVTTYIRVTPGEHTFTLYFIRDGKEIPASITYNCKTSKIYRFTLIAKTYDTGGARTGMSFPTRTEIVLREFYINEKGNIDAWKEVTEARKTQIHDGFNDGVDMKFILTN